MLDTSPSRPGPLPVWPYYFTAAVAAVAGLAMIWIWSPEDSPAKADLVKLSGDIATVRIRDNISGTGAGMMMTGFTTVYFTFEDGDGEYFYPSNQPDYLLVRDFTAVNIDVWVEAVEIGGASPLRIWQIKENNPYNPLAAETFVAYETIIARLTTIGRSMIVTGRWLLILAGALILFGWTVQKRNRRRFPEWDLIPRSGDNDP